MTKQRTLLVSLKEVAIIIAIAILVPMTIHYGSTMISPYPEGDGFVNIGISSYRIEDAEAQIAKKQYNKKELQEIKKRIATAKNFEPKLKKYQKTLFYTCLISGVALIIFSLCFKIYLIDTGLILGAIFSLINGYAAYWDMLPNIIQFISLIIALILVITLTYIKIIKKT